MISFSCHLSPAVGWHAGSWCDASHLGLTLAVMLQVAELSDTDEAKALQADIGAVAPSAANCLRVLSSPLTESAHLLQVFMYCEQA